MHPMTNQFLVGSIQQFASNLYLNQLASDMSIPSQLLPKMRTIRSANPFVAQISTNKNINHERVSLIMNDEYNLWSGLSLLDILQQEPSEIVLTKRKNSECSANSSTSSVYSSSSNESINRYNHHHQIRGQDLPSTKAYVANNRHLDFLAAVVKTTKNK